MVTETVTRGITCDSMGNNTSDVSRSQGVPVLADNHEKLGDDEARTFFSAWEPQGPADAAIADDWPSELWARDFCCFKH